jgi:hypothetical protein
MKFFKITLAIITGILFYASLAYGSQVANEEHIDGYIIGIYYLLIILTILELVIIDNQEITNKYFIFLSLFLTLFPFCLGTLLLYGCTSNIDFLNVNILIIVYANMLLLISITDFVNRLQGCINFYKAKNEKETSVKYYYAVGSKQFGPFSVSVLKNKNLSLDTYVWTESMTEWKKIKDIPDLKSEIASSLPPPLPPNES